MSYTCPSSPILYVPVAEWLRWRAHDPRVMGLNPGPVGCTRKIVSLVLGPVPRQVQDLGQVPADLASQHSRSGRRGLITFGQYKTVMTCCLTYSDIVVYMFTPHFSVFQVRRILLNMGICEVLTHEFHAQLSST